MIRIGTLHIDTDGVRKYEWHLDDVWVTKRLLQAVEAKREEIEFQTRKLEGDWYNISVDETRLKLEGTNTEIDLNIDLEETVVVFNNKSALETFLGGLVAVRDGMFRGQLTSLIGFKSERDQWLDQMRQMVLRLTS